MSGSSSFAANTISFSKRKIASPAFQRLYDEGMTLVEETASYLDGEGRTHAKYLSRPATSLYAAESMRLTTRLMQISSWLLLHRANNSGEMTADQIEEERVKIRLDSASADRETVGWNFSI
jgi:regulator of CtrA degradation